LTRDDITLTLPGWIGEFVAGCGAGFDGDEAKMGFVIGLARRNIEAGTGGPFGAGVFEIESGRLIAPGVNLVTSANCSLAHAEMVAIGIAQQRLGTYDLSSGETAYELVTSTEPCAMCLGAIPWSGVRRVVCGARGADACAIGFDEGAKPDDWVGSLRERGIEVVCDVLRDRGQAVLQQYLTSNGEIYNAQRD